MAPAHRSRPATAPARRCAHALVRRVFERGARADAALHEVAAGLDPRDRALAMRLGYGAVQRAGTLDHVIEALADRPAARLDPPVRAALLVGLYELLYLAGAPDYAVVADAVELAKAPGRAGHGLVNAVMRRATREGEALVAGLSDETPAQAALKHSHPEWIARLWFDELGPDDARALMRADNEPVEVALRANTLVAGVDALARELQVATHRDDAIPEALVLDGPFDAHGSPGWGAGAFTAQARAAMLVSRALAPQPGESVLDLCAAPGGKATHLAALMGDDGRVVAVERSRSRARALTATALRLRAASVEVVVADAAEPRADRFDRVLVDPPCTGLGTLQARPDQRWRQTPERAAELAALQGRILAAGAEALRPGGVLVYSTCTVSATENESLIAAFLDSHADFSADDLASELPAYALAHVRPGGLAAGGAGDVASRCLLTLPHRDRTAGFFIARLRRASR